MTTQKKALVKSYNLIQGDSDNVRPHISRLKQQREIERKRKAVRRLRKLLTVQREYDAPIVGTPDTKRKRIINIDRGNREQVCRLIVKDLQTVGRVQ